MTSLSLQQYLPFTVLKQTASLIFIKLFSVATVLTVYGIETNKAESYASLLIELQQYLPFTVLKQELEITWFKMYHISCNSTYRLRY